MKTNEEETEMRGRMTNRQELCMNTFYGYLYNVRTFAFKIHCHYDPEMYQVFN